MSSPSSRPHCFFQRWYVWALISEQRDRDPRLGAPTLASQLFVLSRGRNLTVGGSGIGEDVCSELTLFLVPHQPDGDETKTARIRT